MQVYENSEKTVSFCWKMLWIISHMPDILELAICTTCTKLGAENMRKAALSGQAQRWSTAFLSIELSHTKSEEGNAASPNFFLRKKKKQHLSSSENPGQVLHALDIKLRPG